MKAEHLVVDAGALVREWHLWEYGGALYSTPEVMLEIKDRQTRERVQALPVKLTMKQPQPQSIRFVNEFSKKTGDYASLSLADVMLIALTYELEVEVKGGDDHLSLEPQKPVTIGASTRRKKEEHQHQPEGFYNPINQPATGQLEDGMISPSPSDTTLDKAHMTPPRASTRSISPKIYRLHLVGLNTILQDYPYITGYSLTGVDIAVHQIIVRQCLGLCIPFDNTLGCLIFDHDGTPIFPSSFPHLQRWAIHLTRIPEKEKKPYPSDPRCAEESLRRALLQALRMEEGVSHTGQEAADLNPAHLNNSGTLENNFQDLNIAACHGQDNRGGEKEADSGDNYNEDGYKERNSEGEDSSSEEDESEDDNDGWITCSNLKKHKAKNRTFNPEKEEEDEQREVKVACITGDFSVQNVLMHIGLPVMGVDGKVIKYVRTYILRCHACYKTCSVMSKIFCPSCGNKTLKKVAVNLNSDGSSTICINTKKPISTKGMKYSLPTPKGGKHARNPILVADQREAKRLSSRMSKKRTNPLHEDYDPDHTPFAVRDVYSRAAQLGYIGGKNHHHFYWEKRNPNEPQRRTGKK